MKLILKYDYVFKNSLFFYIFIFYTNGEYILELLDGSYVFIRNTYSHRSFSVFSYFFSPLHYAETQLEIINVQNNFYKISHWEHKVLVKQWCMLQIWSFWVLVSKLICISKIWNKLDMRSFWGQKDSMILLVK